MRRFGDWPVWVRLTGAIWFCLVLAWGALIAWETQVSREIAIDQARDLAHSMNEMTLAGLTGMMITGTVGQRDVFLDQIRELTAVRDLRVIRGEAVSKLYGPGAGEKAKPHDDIERAVLATGKAHIEIENTPQLGEHLRVVYPTLASRNYLGKNCLTCHQVPENTPLGAVSMRISLEKTNAAVTAFRDKSILFALIVSLPLMAVVYLFVRRFVTRPLQAMSDGLEELAKGEGDLTRRLAVAGRDEIGATAERFNRMLATIAELVRRVGQSATDVTRSARRLADDAARVADGSQQQKAQSGAAAGTVEILAGHIGEIAGSAEEVCRRAEESLARAEEGQRSLGHLRDHVAEVEKAVEIMAEAENDFMKSTSEITAMTQQVREIAEQTNLLALNAAIEAARAGESGRGFAVVADEVRKLAEKSAVSAAQIDSVTAGLGNKSNAVRDALEASLESLQASRASADRVAEVLHTATSSAHSVRTGLEQIVQVTVHQREESGTVTRNIEEIARMAEDNDAAIRQVVEASEALETLAEDLQQSVSRFKV